MVNIHKKKKIGLVLSGGGVKAAAYHIGVCMALKEYGFTFSGGEQTDKKPSAKTIQLYVGSSAGAFISATLASGRSLESLISAFQVGIGHHPSYKIPNEQKLKAIGYRHMFNLNSKNMLSFIPQGLLNKTLIAGGWETVLKRGFKLNGVFNTRGIERYMNKYMLDQNDFSKLNTELYIIATQLNHSRKTVFGHFKETFKDEHLQTISHAKISEAVAASTALPPVFAPYPIKASSTGKEIWHYDGEIRDTLSTHVAADHGADLILASYSMQPYHYVSKIGSLHTYGMPAIINQALYQVLEQKVARHIQFQEKKKDLYQTMKELCANENLSQKLTEKILTTVKDRLDLKPEVDTVYISPLKNNYEMFFADHFSLKPEILEKLVKVGFKSAALTLKKHGLDT